MLKLLQLIFIGHTHIWETLQKVNVYDDGSRTMPVGNKYYLKCKCCGKIKSTGVI